MYIPKPTNALMLNQITGVFGPIRSTTLLIDFSSDADDALIVPLMKALDPNVIVEDGVTDVGMPIQYGEDGRHITFFKGNYPLPDGTSIPYTTCVGLLLAQKELGSAWNDGDQPPYTKLEFFVDQAGGYVQPNWGH